MWGTNSKGRRRSVNRKRPGSDKRRADWHQLDVKARTRKRRRPARHRNYGLWIKIAAIVVTLGSLTLGGRWLYQQSVAENTEFKLQKLVIISDGALTPRHLTEVAGVKAGANMLSLDLEKIRQSLEALPLVETATIERVFPSNLEIRVTERRPVAWLACAEEGVLPYTAETGVLLSDDGMVLECDVVMPQFERLPVISVLEIPQPGAAQGPMLRNLPVALELLEKSYERISLSCGISEKTGELMEIVEIQIHRAYSLTCVYNQDLRVTFAPHDIDRQLQDLEWILTESASAGRRLSTVNTMMSRNIPVTFHDTTVPGGSTAPHLRPLRSNDGQGEGEGSASGHPNLRQILLRG
jgi:hypothetical protein